MTNWTQRDLNLSLNFLPQGKQYTMEIFRDGANADTEATDYKKEIITVTAASSVTIAMAPGGGWTARLVEK